MIQVIVKAYVATKDFLFVHDWLHASLVVIPTVLLAIREAHHSGEANKLRKDANEKRDEANALGKQGNELREKQAEHLEQIAEQRRELNKLQAENNSHLGKIEGHLQRPSSEAQKNSERLRQHLGERVAVSNANDSTWGAVLLLQRSATVTSLPFSHRPDNRPLRLMLYW